MRFDPSFTLGSIIVSGEVIKAWDLGVATMKRGEKAILTCRPEYAYGEAGAPPNIPPNSTLLFEVELFDWKGNLIIDPAPFTLKKFIEKRVRFSSLVQLSVTFLIHLMLLIEASSIVHIKFCNCKENLIT